MHFVYGVLSNKVVYVFVFNEVFSRDPPYKYCVLNQRFGHHQGLYASGLIIDFLCQERLTSSIVLPNVGRHRLVGWLHCACIVSVAMIDYLCGCYHHLNRPRKLFTLC